MHTNSLPSALPVEALGRPLTSWHKRKTTLEGAAGVTQKTHRAEADERALIRRLMHRVESAMVGARRG